MARKDKLDVVTKEQRPGEFVTGMVYVRTDGSREPVKDPGPSGSKPDTIRLQDMQPDAFDF